MGSNASVRVNLRSTSKKNGLAVQWPLSANWRHEVDVVKQCLGLSFDKKESAWVSEGPEILLDMNRFGIQIDNLTPEARRIAEKFRKQIWDTIDCRQLDIEAEMYGYQAQGAKFLSIMPSAILGDDMGTGKSKQSLDAASLIRADQILVLAPKTLCYNWLDEVQKWHPEWTVEVLPDGAKERKEYWSIGRDLPNVTIANYEKLQRPDWPDKERWDVIICDEASRLKNSKTVTYKRVKRIAQNTRYIWALTGTPLEIRVEELYSILSLLRPSVLGGFMRFKDAHLNTDWNGNVVGVKNLPLLRDRIAPFILRRTKKELRKQLQLPEKLPPQNLLVKLSPEEVAAYEGFKDQVNNWLSAHNVSGKGNALVEMLRSRQFCATPAIFTDELGKGSKFHAIKEIIDEWEGKVVLFSFFEGVISKYHEWLKCHPEAIISGKVSSANGERIRRIKAFNEGKLGKVLCCTDAGNMGLNITGANLVIHIDQLWNPQKMKQREDRLDRIGQTEPVTVMNAMCLDTIDYGMYLVNKERIKLFEDVVDGAEEAILMKLNAPRLKRIMEGKSIDGYLEGDAEVPRSKQFNDDGDTRLSA